jgi:hypothetical protein
MVFDEAGNDRGQVKTAVNTLFPHAVHVKTRIIGRKEVDRALHQDRICRSLVIGHAEHDARNTGQSFRNKPGRMHCVLLLFHFFQIILPVRHFSPFQV